MHRADREFIEWELLWLRCRRGDPDVIEALVQKLERPLYYFIRRIVGNADAWDVLQQSWVRVLAGMKTVAGASTLKPWIYRTARNTAINHNRAGRRYRATIENTNPPANTCDNDTIEFVASALWIFAVRLSVHFIALIRFINNPSIAIHFLGIAMIAMISAALQLLRVCIEQAELNTHQRLLETLYRLSEVSSRVEK